MNSKKTYFLLIPFSLMRENLLRTSINFISWSYVYVSTQIWVNNIYIFMNFLSTLNQNILPQNISGFWPFWSQNSVLRRKTWAKFQKFYWRIFSNNKTNQLLKDVQNCFVTSKLVNLAQSLQSMLKECLISVFLAKILHVNDNRQEISFMNCW